MTTRNLQRASLRLPIPWRGALSLIADLRSVFGSAADRALDLTLPATCAGCYLDGTPLCRECRALLELRLSSGDGDSTGLIAAPPVPLLQLEWCAPFEGITRRSLDRLGDGSERRLSGPLGQAIADRWARAGNGGDILVPVPKLASLVREHGYDEAVLLARVAGRRLRLPVVQALARRAVTRREWAYTRGGEDARSDSRFDVIGMDRIKGRWVVLVDGVVTSGATLGACATVLLRAGASAVSAVTVARDHWVAPEPAPLSMVS